MQITVAAWLREDDNVTADQMDDWLKAIKTTGRSKWQGSLYVLLKYWKKYYQLQYVRTAKTL